MNQTLPILIHSTPKTNPSFNVEGYVELFET
jgi:hypothetical protein